MKNPKSITTLNKHLRGLSSTAGWPALGEICGGRGIDEEQIEKIHLAAIEEEKHLDCPHCGHTRLVVRPASTDVPGEGWWIDGGDIIFGLYRDLVTAGFEDDVDDATLRYSYRSLTGSCPSCQKTYGVLTATMIDDAAVVDHEFVERYFDQILPAPDPVNYSARLESCGLEWLVHWHDTPKGVALKHVFGPFNNAISFIERQYVFGLWPHLKALSRAVNRGRGNTPLLAINSPERKTIRLDVIAHAVTGKTLAIGSTGSGTTMATHCLTERDDIELDGEINEGQVVISVQSATQISSEELRGFDNVLCLRMSRESADAVLDALSGRDGLPTADELVGLSDLKGFLVTAGGVVAVSIPVLTTEPA